MPTQFPSSAARPRPRGTSSSAGRLSKLKIAGGIALLIVLLLLVMPRWRRATVCTLTGGKWAAGSSAGTEVECRAKSETAGKACSGQIRNECDQTFCDLERKQPGNAGGGTCPDTYVKYFYTTDGQFFQK